MTRPRISIPIQKLSKITEWRYLPLVELFIIALWGLWMGRAYLDMDPLRWPHGREFGMVIHPQYIWTLLRECGTCILWNGYANGGQPSFAELQAPMLHPLMFIPTILFGALSGTKIMLVGSFIMAGWGQWWLNRVMRLGFIARMWGALMIVSAGHLAGRMELGVVGLVISTAACSLVLAPALKVAIGGKREDTIILAIVLALAIVSGQGYMQIGLVVAIFPAFIIYLFDDNLKLRPVWKEFLLAGGLACLLAGIFLVPLLHFWPNFGKEVVFDFSYLQPLEHLPFNFVIRNTHYYFTEALEKLPYPYLTVNYIGWIPVFLATLPLYFVRRGQRKLLLFFGLAIFLTLLATDGFTFRILYKVWPSFVSGIRMISLIAGLAVPLIMALSAWGLDELLKTDWPTHVFATTTTLNHPRLMRAVFTFFVLSLLYVSLSMAYNFNKQWVYTIPILPETIEVIETAVTDTTQWIAAPYGEHFWGALSAEKGIKLTELVRPAHWRFRNKPLPHLELHRSYIAPNPPPDALHGISRKEHPENQYAYILTNPGKVPCDAHAQGGTIKVTCNSDRPGKLVVQEFGWRGWHVTRDGEAGDIYAGVYLSTDALAGEHTYIFRYLPLDVLIGLCLSIIGIILAIWLWIRASKTSDTTA